MGRVYRPGEDPMEGDQAPSALAIGDSWFWYINQTLLLSLVNHPQVSNDHASIRLLGFNGARLRDYVGDGHFADEIRMRLRPGFREGFSEFYVSGFGNDALDRSFALLADCSAIGDPVQCLSKPALDSLLEDIDRNLRALIGMIRAAYPETAPLLRPIFLNGYDYPVPDGRGLLGQQGWITKAMNEARVKPERAFRQEVIKYFIDAINDRVLKPLHDPGNKVFHMDARGTLASTAPDYQRDWANELHPTSRGFKTILEQCWFPILKPFGIILERRTETALSQPPAVVA